MPDAPPPNPTDLLHTALTTGLKLNIGGTLPGEALITSLIAYAASVRATMDPALQKRLDAVLVQQVEDVQKLWRGLWVTMGVIKE